MRQAVILSFTQRGYPVSPDGVIKKRGKPRKFKGMDSPVTDLRIRAMFAARLRCIRSALGVAQADMARAVGIKPPKQNHYESGLHIPSNMVLYLWRLSTAYGLPHLSSYLIMGVKDRLPPELRQRLEALEASEESLQK
jgi:transcriptional regulator with XRE-family HTH domain